MVKWFISQLQVTSSTSHAATQPESLFRLNCKAGVAFSDWNITGLNVSDWTPPLDFISDWTTALELTFLTG